MNTNQSVLNRDSEFRLIQRLDRIEATLYKIKRSLFKWGIGLAFILVASEGFIYLHSSFIN